MSNNNWADAYRPPPLAPSQWSAKNVEKSPNKTGISFKINSVPSLTLHEHEKRRKLNGSPNDAGQNSATSTIAAAKPPASTPISRNAVADNDRRRVMVINDAPQRNKASKRAWNERSTSNSADPRRNDGQDPNRVYWRTARDRKTNKVLHPLAQLDDDRQSCVRMSLLPRADRNDGHAMLVPWFGKTAEETQNASMEYFREQMACKNVRATKTRRQHRLLGEAREDYLSADTSTKPRFENTTFYAPYLKDFSKIDAEKKRIWRATRGYRRGHFNEGNSLHMPQRYGSCVQWQQLKNLFHMLLVRESCPLGSMQDTQLNIIRKSLITPFPIPTLTAPSHGVGVLWQSLLSAANVLNIPLHLIMPRSAKDHDKVAHMCLVPAPGRLMVHQTPTALVHAWLWHSYYKYVVNVATNDKKIDKRKKNGDALVAAALSGKQEWKSPPDEPTIFFEEHGTVVSIEKMLTLLKV